MDECHSEFTHKSSIDSVVPIQGQQETTRLAAVEPSVGGAPANALSVTFNYESHSHRDRSDGRWSAIAW